MHTLILVDYNAMEQTISYILRCREAMGESIEHVAVVENGRSEGVLELLQTRFGDYETEMLLGISQQVYLFSAEGLQICYCHSGENMGYARGNNLGASIAKALWSDPYYIISNNDLYFEKPLELDVAQKLFAAHPQIGVVGPGVITPEGDVQSPRVLKTAFEKLFLVTWIHAAGVFLPWSVQKKLVDKHVIDTLPEALTGRCDWVSGCFFIVRADMFHQAGMFDEATFLYGEEMILAKRLEAIGGQVWFCRELNVVHCHAQTTRSVLSEMKMQEITFQSMCHYYKTYTCTSPVLLVLAKWNFALYKAVFYGWQKVKKIIKRS